MGKMTLSAVRKGKIPSPYRLLVMGVDGVGKSTFGAGAPGAVFLGPESGTNQLDVARFPVPDTFAEFREGIHALTENKGSYQTLVVDTIDWVEPLIARQLCVEHSASSIDEVAGGYGKGYTLALDQWRAVLSDIERLQAKQGMNVLLLAHAFVKAFRNPEGEDYDRYVLKMHDKAASLVREWCEGVYFAQYETFAQKKKGAAKAKGVSSGARLLYTQRTAAYDAKDRYNVPAALPLNWEDFDRAVKASSPADPVELEKEIRRKASAVGGEVEAASLAWLEEHKMDAVQLSMLNDRLNAKLAEKE